MGKDTEARELIFPLGITKREKVEAAISQFNEQMVRMKAELEIED